MSPISISVHNDFHRKFVGAPLPTELARYFALHSIGLPDMRQRMSPGQVKNIFEITSMQSWYKLYQNGATKPSTTPYAALRIAEEQETMLTYLLRELAWVRSTRERLQGGSAAFPWEEHPLLRDGEAFFHAQSPREAIELLLTNRHDDTLTWARAIHDQTREAILTHVRRCEYSSPHDHPDYDRVLTAQQTYLDSHIRTIRSAQERLAELAARIEAAKGTAQTPEDAE